MSGQTLRPRTSLRLKLVLTMLTTLTIVAASTMALVSWMQIKGTEVRLVETEQQIRSSLQTKGKILADNHALALHNLVLDNGFSDVRSLIEGAVADDEDVVYGLFLSAENQPWAYVSPSHPQTDDAKLEQEGWKELGLGVEPEPLSKPETREVDLFGERIHEFAAPVIDEGEVLGVLRYGVSTGRMRKALESARIESDETLRETLRDLAALVMVCMVFGVLLVLRAARRITSPLNLLTEAASRITQGEKNVQADVRSGDEIELLAKTFNQMVTELSDSYRELEGLNDSLEDKVTARTKELAARNHDMRLIMDNVQQGFITVYPNGVMAQERSAVVETMFGADPPPRFADYLERIDPKFALMFSLGLEALVEDILPREVCLDQFPSRAYSDDRTFDFHFEDLSQGDEFGGLLVVVEDVTEKLEAERVQSEQAELMSAFRRVMKDRDGFESFLKDTTRQVHAVVAGSLDDDEVVFKRVVHTLKGNCGVMGLGVMARICHRLEEVMEHGSELPPAEERRALADRWALVCDSIEPLLGKDDSLEVERGEYTDVVSLLAERGNEALAERMRSWELEPISKQFSRIEEQAVALAARLGRGPLRVDAEGRGIRLDSRRWSGFWSDVTHLVRNCVDHGLYAADDVPQGHGVQRLVLRASVEGEFLSIEVGDNGRGIDWQAVRERAKQLGIPHEDKKDLVNALFHDGLSTRESVSETSGRGVGMSALRATCTRLGGRIYVRSEPGRGSTFTMKFPLEGTYVAKVPAAA